MDTTRLNFDPSLAILDTAVLLEGAMHSHRHIFCDCLTLDSSGNLERDGFRGESPHLTSRAPYLRRLTWAHSIDQFPPTMHQIIQSSACSQAYGTHDQTARPVFREPTDADPATSALPPHLLRVAPRDTLDPQLGGHSNRATESPAVGEEFLCAICHDALHAASGDILRLPCSHLFHGACMRPWLARSRTCPTCRYSLRLTSAAPVGEASAAAAAAAEPAALVLARLLARIWQEQDDRAASRTAVSFRVSGLHHRISTAAAAPPPSPSSPPPPPRRTGCTVGVATAVGSLGRSVGNRLSWARDGLRDRLSPTVLRR
jgi:hypothetical protein